ncbi:hypothetical protein F511_32930 [Dorcoceras hygrometricum]|uniref:Uncharacterized protein n=1 Tax=Dorcoceras hygrometricum TaxID=472368 RepID=A0A2Z7AKI6_9LAMI|nr:hypothetical protein F511_32930 [Dorcoceras hygrometricum]
MTSSNLNFSTIFPTAKNLTPVLLLNKVLAVHTKLRTAGNSYPDAETSGRTIEFHCMKKSVTSRSSPRSLYSLNWESYNRNQLQPSDVAFTKEHQNDVASTNQNDAAALQQLATDSFLNNQQLVTLNNSNDIVKNTSPLLPTADQKRCNQNAAFQLIKTTSLHHQQLLPQLIQSDVVTLLYSSKRRGIKRTSKQKVALDENNRAELVNQIRERKLDQESQQLEAYDGKAEGCCSELSNQLGNQLSEVTC